MDGLYEICFKSLDKYYKLISFDFDFSDTEKHLLTGITDIKLLENMDQVSDDLALAYRDMQKISRN